MPHPFFVRKTEDMYGQLQNPIDDPTTLMQYAQISSSEEVGDNNAQGTIILDIEVQAGKVAYIGLLELGISGAAAVLVDIRYAAGNTIADYFGASPKRSWEMASGERSQVISPDQTLMLSNLLGTTSMWILLGLPRNRAGAVNNAGTEYLSYNLAINII